MRIRVRGDGGIRIRVVIDRIVARGHGCGALHREPPLDERDPETRAGAVLGGVRGVQEVGEKEADELEGHGDHGVPDEAEEGADGEAFDVDFIAEGAGGEDGGFPVRGCCVGGGLFVGL